MASLRHSTLALQDAQTGNGILNGGRQSPNEPLRVVFSTSQRGSNMLSIPKETKEIRYPCHPYNEGDPLSPASLQSDWFHLHNGWTQHLQYTPPHEYHQRLELTYVLSRSLSRQSLYFTEPMHLGLNSQSQLYECVHRHPSS